MAVDRDVVITGIGILSPIGIGKDSYWEGLAQGRTGFKKISLFDTSGFNVHIAGEIDFDPVQFLGKKGLRDLDRSIKLVNSAAKLALDDSRLEITEANSPRMGVAIGTTFGSLHSISQFDRTGLIEGPRSVNPSHFPNTVINSPASQISIRFNIKGFNTTISTGFCASLDAVSYAADFIKLNRADAVLAGGIEELCEETFLGFHTLGCLSGAYGSEPISCPFDARRNGIILSEGAAVLVMEEKAHAAQRGATILAQIAGYANSFDPFADRRFNPEGAGLKSAICTALKEASLVPRDIDYICSCANSTKELDKMETQVIKDVFGEYAYQAPVSSIKSMIGESYSASGALSLAAAVGVIKNGFIPPTVNYKEKDPECGLDYVPNKSREKRVNKVLVTSADPYGQNTAVVIGRHE
ncbi:MAG: beta-ketoacyl-[acyl-carrier-protein] synthase family protein [Deltaproteobacteria bacterium]|nr:beta-ketoacyl-[acyl-carrier-protein] synthase family protein [Deltaproteobacteria bacterium]